MWLTFGSLGQPARERPGGEHAVALEPQVPVQPPRRVLMDDEARPGARRVGRALLATAGSGVRAKSRLAWKLASGSLARPRVTTCCAGVRALAGARGVAGFLRAGLGGATSTAVACACLPTAAMLACSAAIRSGTAVGGCGPPARSRSPRRRPCARSSRARPRGSRRGSARARTGAESISISWRATSSSRSATFVSVPSASSSSESAGTTSSA